MTGFRRVCAWPVVMLSMFAACSGDGVAGSPLVTQSGGDSAVTGGVQPFAGGASATGGELPTTGGVAPESGGALPTTGGELPATGGVATTGGLAMTGGDVAQTGGDVAGTGGQDVSQLAKFSFFVTSLESMRLLSGSQDGFGGNYGGLAGADKICQDIAQGVGFGAKTWRAFLSATDDGSGIQVDAIDRIGQGPWYDRNERLIAQNVDGLINRGTSRGQGRPDGDSQAISDLADENGQGLDSAFGDDDNHDIVTGSDQFGRLDKPGDLAATCNDWTSTTVDPSGGGGGGGGFPGFPGGGGFSNGVRVGHAWPAGSGYNWIAAHGESSCAAGVNLDGSTFAGDGSSIGAGGGWGAIYCFALQP